MFIHVILCQILAVETQVPGVQSSGFGFFLQVNPQLFSSREKEQMHELIDTMLAYNLSYRQDRTPEGQYTYVLEP